MSEVAQLVIRAEEPRDRRVVFDVNARAGPQQAEANLVDALRAAGVVHYRSEFAAL